MPLANCVRCKKMFNKSSLPVCPACEAAEEADFQKVRDALEEMPDQNVEQLAESTGVDTECIIRMLDEGRIENIQPGEIVKCGRCGAPAISASKKLCEKCLQELNVEVARAQSSIKLGAKKNVQIMSVHDALENKRRL